MWLFKFSHLLWLLVIFQLFASSFGFFPMFENFFARFRNGRNNNGNFGKFFGGGNNGGGGGGQGGGVNILNTAASASTGHGNVTSLTVPMLSPALQRRVGIVTTVISSNAAPEGDSDDQSNSTLTSASTSITSSANQQIDLQQNVTTSEAGTEVGNSSSLAASIDDQQPLGSISSSSQKLAIPTSISVTSSISTSQQGGVGVPVALNRQGAPNTLTLPFTPNLFGMMSYVQAMKDIKRNYKDQEKERKLHLFNMQGGDDLMTRILRTLIQKVVNKHQKHTEMLRLKILKRQDKLQNFLQLPMVSQVIALDQGRAAIAGGGVVGISHPLQFGNGGAGVLVPQATATSQVVVSRSGKPVHSILNSFMI